MTETIVIIGSLNADLVVRTDRFPKPGETLHGSDLAILPGGKSANQAVAAGRLGGAVRMIGAVGDDGNGALLRDSVAAAGADTTHVAVREGTATGTAVITVDASGENTIVISGGANATLTPDDLPAEAFRDAAVLGLCLEVSIDVVLAAARAAHEAGVTVLTNLSPFGDVPRELLDLTDVLLVNEHEAAALGDHGVARSIVTRGGDGSVVHDGDAAPVEVPAVPVEAVDTTGCGDAFMGAVALRLAAGDTLLEAARFAAGVGAYAATGAGAQASYPTTPQLEAFLRA
ncbi:ribokinase [Curtobacterium sp. MMLR14_010]|uniref:ribokinase n=1 Tax=Curtobacterium sp. MMLR14_010 TaxID=1898743 RepID=UPI0008DE0941|nr:ribokinase [Curtobacterium sp. MMLR14_010]OII31873.1 ribokinase [Curtobacterium sp. MMLR14_010]